jgi:hypothetical protein
MDKYRYYEIIACDLSKVEPKVLFEKTRKREVVYSRWFCMYYRHIVLGYSYCTSAKRYIGMDHTSCGHAIKKIEEYTGLYKDFKEIFDDFLKRCHNKREMKEKETSVQGVCEVEKTPEFVMVLMNINKRFTHLQKSIYDFLEDECDDTTVYEDIKMCYCGLEELDILFDNGNQRTLDS